MTCRVLIVYDSGGGNTRMMANSVARGVESAPQTNDIRSEAVVRSVPPLASVATTPNPAQAAAANSHDLATCDALIIGTPVHFGNMSAAMKAYIDNSADVWMQGKLSGKPAAVFTSGGSMHGGQESTLLTLILPMLHHGMLIVGLPYSEAALRDTVDGGTPYGPSHVSGNNGDTAMSAHERQLCLALGRRVALTAQALNAANNLTVKT